MPVYSYKELKGKIKVGDRVRAAEGKDNGCSLLECRKESRISEVEDDRFSINGCSHPYMAYWYLELLAE